MAEESHAVLEPAAGFGHRPHRPGEVFRGAEVPPQSKYPAFSRGELALTTKPLRLNDEADFFMTIFEKA